MKLSIIDDLWWGTRLRLPSWAGYQSRFGAYGSLDKPEPSDGTVEIIFAPEGFREVEPLDEQERRLMEWLNLTSRRSRRR